MSRADMLKDVSETVGGQPLQDATDELGDRERQEDIKSDEIIRKLTAEELEDIREAGEVIPSTKPTADILNQICFIGAFAVLGVYCRIVLMQGTPHGYVDYLTSQFTGSFALGLIFHLKEHLHVDIFAGISVGFCGSLTTFSTWQIDIVETLVGSPGAPASAAGKTYVWFQDQLIGFAVPFAGLTFGKHISESIGNHVAFHVQKRTNKLSLEHRSVLTRIFAFAALSLTAIGVIGGAIKVPSLTTFSLIFAPFGALTRFALSRALNSKSVRFYYGTFVANVGGSIIGGIIFGVLNRTTLSSLECYSLWAVSYGFCGSLTTISTFVNEVHTLPLLSSSYLYGFGSVLVTQAFLIIIMGSFTWTQSDPFTDQATCFYTR